MTTCEQNLTVLDICETVYAPIDYPDRPKEEGEAYAAAEALVALSQQREFKKPGDGPHWFLVS